MPCERPDIAEKLVPFVEGALGEPDRSEVAAHVRRCSECQVEATRIKESILTLTTAARQGRWVETVDHLEPDLLGMFFEDQQALKAGFQAMSGLTAEQTRRIRVHLTECSHCREEMSWLEEMETELVGVPAPEPAAQTLPRAIRLEVDRQFPAQRARGTSEAGPSLLDRLIRLLHPKALATASLVVVALTFVYVFTRPMPMAGPPSTNGSEVAFEQPGEGTPAASQQQIRPSGAKEAVQKKAERMVALNTGHQSSDQTAKQLLRSKIPYQVVDGKIMVAASQQERAQQAIQPQIAQLSQRDKARGAAEAASAEGKSAGHNELRSTWKAPPGEADSGKMKDRSYDGTGAQQAQRSASSQDDARPGGVGGARENPASAKPGRPSRPAKGERPPARPAAGPAPRPTPTVDVAAGAGNQAEGTLASQADQGVPNSAATPQEPAQQPVTPAATPRQELVVMADTARDEETSATGAEVGVKEGASQPAAGEQSKTVRNVPGVNPPPAAASNDRVANAVSSGDNRKAKGDDRVAVGNVAVASARPSPSPAVTERRPRATGSRPQNSKQPTAPAPRPVPVRSIDINAASRPQDSYGQTRPAGASEPSGYAVAAPPPQAAGTPSSEALSQRRHDNEGQAVAMRSREADLAPRARQVARQFTANASVYVEQRPDGSVSVTVKPDRKLSGEELDKLRRQLRADLGLGDADTVVIRQP